MNHQKLCLQDFYNYLHFNWYKNILVIKDVHEMCYM